MDYKWITNGLQNYARVIVMNCDKIYLMYIYYFNT